ncbi:MAG: hypothetical protein GXO75_03765 [Calditrichaeota bacterium]|nr:hypothetical protein [Calditrichota bacterium]
MEDLNDTALFIEEEIKKFYNTLNEKEKRLYAAINVINDYTAGNPMNE